jgi:hypothetical protein
MKHVSPRVAAAMVLAGLGLLLFSSLTAYAKEAQPPPPGWAWGKENNPGNHYGQISNPGHHYAYGRYKHQTPPKVTPPTVTPPTPNGDLHIGHLSGPYLGTDAFVRFQRMNGATVWHLAATCAGGPPTRSSSWTADPDNPYEWLVLPSPLALRRPRSWGVAARAALNAARGRNKAAA